MNTNEFLDRQLEVLSDIQNGDATWAELNTMRSDFLGEYESVDSTRRGYRLLKPYFDEGWVKKPDDVPDTNVGDIVTTRKTISTSADGSQTSECKVVVESEDDLRDPVKLLELHGYDSSKWDLVSSKNSFWGVGSNGKRLYSSKVSAKPKVDDGLDSVEIVKHFEDFAKGYKPSEIAPKQYEYGAEMLVICAFDLHYGKLASSYEINDTYNHVVAKQRLLDSIKTYISKLRGRKFEKIVFPIGNDFFNSEFTGSTTGGTPQSNSARFSELFVEGTKVLIEAIDLLSTVAPVDVILIGGNHSRNTEHYCACVIDAWYRNSDVVTVDSSPTLRKYIRFGNNLLGFAHGSDEKDRIFGLMQVEAAEDWGAKGVNTREWLLAHRHSEAVVEKNGVIARTVPTVSGNDDWLYRVGFTTSKKRSVAYVYDKAGGLVETYYANV